MRAANLYHVRELFGLCFKRLLHTPHRRDQRIVHAFGGGNVHGRGKSVIRRLRHIDVVVGMDRILRPKHAPGQLDGAIGDDFVGIHIGLRAAARLPNAQGKFVIQRAGDDFITGLKDQARFLARQFAQFLIHHSAGLFQNSKGANQLRRHGVPADIEMHEGTRGLSAPIDIGGNFDRPHAIGFRTHRLLCHDLTHDLRVPSTNQPAAQSNAPHFFPMRACVENDLSPAVPH